MHVSAERVFKEFLESLNSRPCDMDTIKAEFRKLCEHYDVPVFALSSLCLYDPLRQFEVFHNYPSQWVNEYKTKGYHIIDPVHKRAQGSLIPFGWDEAFLRTESDLNNQFADKAKQFGVQNGFTIPLLKDNLRTHILTLTNVKFPHPEIIYRISSASIAYIQNYKKMFTSHKSALSPRETQIQELAASGKSIKSISESLGISMATVIFHINNAKKKLNANTLNQSIYLFGKNSQLRSL